MAPTPSSKSLQSQGTPARTPQAKQRLHLATTPKIAQPSLNPSSAVNKDTTPAEHPVEVIGRIRDYVDKIGAKAISALQVSSDGRSIRVRTDIGYRDFSLDGVSMSEDEDLGGFYKKFVESRINGVKVGEKCTIMMYGPTGSGKSHTMFGCPKQPGIVYRALRDILGEADEENGGVIPRFGAFVQVTVLEIYNEEIYDLLSSNGNGGAGFGWPRGNASKARLEVMGGKAKNATFISGNEAGKISREVAKVEKRRIVKSTLCNERSSRSHCMIILDVPSVGGRLMLVDMAGSENIDQAGQTGFEAKMQTAKINQGNIALKRVVESIANGDSHVPFRDSKLTMLLQDSFEDDKSKILMILCANPDPKDLHKTISTLEYGAKAKCIVRGSNTPAKDKTEDSSTLVLGSRIAAMDQFIFKLQMENKLKEKERDEAQKKLSRKEKENAELRAKLEATRQEEINVKVLETTRVLKMELEKKMEECQKIANEFVEVGRKRMEEKILQQQEEVEILRRRLEEIESELWRAKGITDGEIRHVGVDGNNFIRSLSAICANGDRGMEMSMDLDMGEQPAVQVQDVIEANDALYQVGNTKSNLELNPCLWDAEEDDDVGLKYPEKVCLSTVFEAAEEEEEGDADEVEKEVVEEKATQGAASFLDSPNWAPNSFGRDLCRTDNFRSEKESSSARRTRIQNIFMLCGNHRELSQNVRTPTPTKKKPTEATDIRFSPMPMPVLEEPATILRELSECHISYQPEFSSHDNIFTSDGIHKANTGENNIARVEPAVPMPVAVEDKVKSVDTQMGILSETIQESKENQKPGNENADGLVEVYVKWEATKECGGKFITKLMVLNNSSLADLRKQIEYHFGEENKKQAFFAFLMLGDPTGAPVAREKEQTIQVSKLPICNNQRSGHLASLRPVKKMQRPDQMPFSPLENKLPARPASFLTGLQA
ncbi:kinesin-like protein KIN-10A [Aristolochia californica]|uniref:kinesin-like protein KIN-10A n=1 Tax=Aristolochia californica TaxID=171875 RepID=UPI0035DBC229